MAPGGADFATVFADEKRIRLALPDPQTMQGWTAATSSARTADGDHSCGPDDGWDCTAVATGRVKYKADGESAGFELIAFADRTKAQEACRKEAEWSAKYTALNVSPAGGGTSHAYGRNAGGLDGTHLVVCLGTVVATTVLEGGPVDLPALQKLSATFTDRIRTAAGTA